MYFRNFTIPFDLCIACDKIPFLFTNIIRKRFIRFDIFIVLVLLLSFQFLSMNVEYSPSIFCPISGYLNHFAKHGSYNSLKRLNVVIPFYFASIRTYVVRWHTYFWKVWYNRFISFVFRFRNVIKHILRGYRQLLDNSVKELSLFILYLYMQILCIPIDWL